MKFTQVFLLYCFENSFYLTLCKDIPNSKHHSRQKFICASLQNYTCSLNSLISTRCFVRPIRSVGITEHRRKILHLHVHELLKNAYENECNTKWTVEWSLFLWGSHERKLGSRNILTAEAKRNLPTGMSLQQRIRSVCASALSDQS